jgi:hypothetical protein
VSDIYKLANAARFAKRRGTPLTAILTVTWKNNPRWRSEGATQQHAWTSLDERLVRAMRSYLQDHCVEAVWVYVRENVSGQGPHTHFLIHVPDRRWSELTQGLRSHLLDALDFNADEERSGLIPIKMTGDKMGTNGMVTDAQLAGACRYLSKTLDPAEAVGTERLVDFLGVKAEPHAPVTCRRVSSSENIGYSARQVAGFKDISDVGALRAFLQDDAGAERRRRRAPRLP